MLQAALLADAADECMMFIRFFDQREVDNAVVATQVKKFIASISMLFFDGGVWATEGHTKVCLEYLEQVSHFSVKGEVRAVGGPLAVSQQLRTRVLKRMQAWAILAKEVVAAEHPAHEVVSCFSCFDLRGWQQQTPQEVRHRGRTKRYDELLRRLGSTFGVDTPSLVNEFFDIGGFAFAYFVENECSNLDAWAYALKSFSSTAQARKRHPAEHLKVVLAEYACISASDSIIESDFSRVKKLLTENRLCLTKELESDVVMILVSDPATDKNAIQGAQEVFQELYASTRKSSRTPRSDKGASRRHAY